MNIDELRKKAADLPQNPGVYMMKNVNKEVIYVGKAKILRNRVSSYFQNTSRHTPKVAAMVRAVRSFEVIITDTEFEALVLENNFIKFYSPKYNILLKDDKGYPYIRVSNTAYPDYTVVAKPSDDGARYFGPYNGRTVAFEVINTVKETLGIPNCKKRFPRDIGRSRACINKEIGRCIGLCEGEIPYEEYRKLIDESLMLLKGESEKLEDKLRSEMETAAEKLEFEHAAKLRDKLRAVEKLRQKQKVTDAKTPDIDIICAYVGEVKGCIVVLHYVNGMLLGKDIELLDGGLEEDDIPTAIEEFITQFYRRDIHIPFDIALSHDIPNDELLEQWLRSKAGRKVSIFTPKRGEKKRLVELAYANAMDEARRATAKEERSAKVLELLKSTASLSEVPMRIEAYDISNTAGSGNVGAMIVLENGRFKKKDYRKFKIKTIVGQDDYGSMREVLLRRFGELEGKDESFKNMPQLILMDGGTAHVGVAVDVLARLGIKCDVLGMVKDDKHRTRALVDVSGNELGIETKPALYSFIGTIQEEVHRFAIKYHKEVRSKAAVSSSLDSIPNIGPERRRLLLREFKTVEKIKNAELEELENVLPANAARSVYDHYHLGTNENKNKKDNSEL